MSRFSSALIASTLLFGISSVAVVATNAQSLSTAASSTTSQSSQFRDGARKGGDGLNVLKAVENNDYSAFQTALESATDPRSTELKAAIKTEDDFNLFVEAHTAKKAGDTSKFDEIMTKLGLPTTAQQEALRQEHKANRDAVEKAMAAGDYEAWKTAVAQSPRGSEILEKITTEAEFKTMVENRQNRQENRQNRQENRGQKNDHKNGFGDPMNDLPSDQQ